ncbi:MAG: branched-chain amino acid ABC transporter permease [Chloroflexi bacterium]|nr:branched-chain amino acid ABC transporter permease [Chloroflexota bacterium]
MATLLARWASARVFFARHPRVLPALVLILAIIYPFVVRIFFISLAIEVLIFALFAMSLDLLLGYTGLTSFGHAAYFGLGAYTLAYISSTRDIALNLTNNLLVTMPAVIIVCALAALAIGFLALRTRGIYYLMVTLAFGQMLHSVALSFSRVTGGSDGLAGVPRPSIGIGPLVYNFDSRESIYFLVLAFLVFSFWILHRIVNSPFGLTLRGIRENEARLRALGYNTFRYKMAASVVAGIFAGIAGALLAAYLSIASPDNLYWTTSGYAMIMLIVGGSGTLTGPIYGAATVRLLRNFISTATDRWETMLGLVFILVVIFAPRGIMGLIHRADKIRE